MDIKKGDVLISMTYLYQDKQLIEKHGIGIVVWEQYYRVGIVPDIIQNFKRVVKKWMIY